MLADIGLTVARQLPIETISGLISGAYSLHGGVVRGEGGRIVSHLLSSGASTFASLIPGGNAISSAVQHGQLWQLSKDVGQVQESVNTVLNVSMAGTVLSGLGLVTSIAGFAYLSHRFSQVDAKLAELERDLKDIKEWLGSLQKSKLQFAIESVRHADSARNKTLRRDMLLQGKREFSTLTHQYKEQWPRCRTVHEIQTVNELYTLAMLGHALVCSNLGLGQEAASDLKAHGTDWTTQARLHTRLMLFNDRPDRLLAAEYVEQLPARALVGFLDFAHDTERGIDWLDELRLSHSKSSSVLEVLAASGFSDRRKSAVADSAGRVAIAQSLRARSAVMDANVAHYDFLEDKGIGATAFQQQLELAREKAGGEAICVYS